MPYKGALAALTSFYNELPMMKGRPSNENRSSVGYLERAASTVMNFRDINALSMAIASRKKKQEIANLQDHRHKTQLLFPSSLT